MLKTLIIYTVLSYLLIPSLIIMCSKIDYKPNTFTDYRFSYDNREAYNNITIFGNVWMMSPITLMLFILELIFNIITYIGEILTSIIFEVIQASTKEKEEI